MARFFNRLIDAEDMDALTTYVYLLKKNNVSIPEKLRQKVYFDSKRIHVLAEKLSDNKLLPKELNDSLFRMKYAQSKLFDRVYYAKDKDSVSFSKKETLKLGDHKISVFFFKLKKASEYSKTSSLYYIALEHKDNSFVLKPYYTSGSRGVFLDETKTEDELVQEALEKVRYKNRKRIVPRSYRNNGY